MDLTHALVEFYILKLTSGYKSGLLCVDEIDVSLHPDAQIRVIQLLDRVSAELDLQIVISSHSLTIIDEISRKRKSNEEDYELVYLKDPNAPYVSKRNDYESIKLDLFSKIYRTAKPKIKVYFEDNIGLEIFNLLKDTFSEIISLCNSGDVEIPTDMLEKLNPDFNIIDPIPAYIGCDNAISLLKADNYFKDVCFVLDGDAQIKKDTKLKKDYSRKTKTYNEFLEVNVIDGRYSKKEMYPNVIYLPSYFPPEFYLFRIIYKYVKEARDLYLFWRNLEDIASDNYTSSLVNEKLRISEFKSSDDNLNIDFLKGADVKQFLLDFCKDSRILVDYYSRPEYIDELISFVELYNESIEHLKRRNYSKLL